MLVPLCDICWDAFPCSSHLWLPSHSPNPFRTLLASCEQQQQQECLEVFRSSNFHWFLWNTLLDAVYHVDGRLWGMSRALGCKLPGVAETGVASKLGPLQELVLPSEDVISLFFESLLHILLGYYGVLPSGEVVAGLSAYQAAMERQEGPHSYSSTGHDDTGSTVSTQSFSHDTSSSSSSFCATVNNMNSRSIDSLYAAATTSSSSSGGTSSSKGGKSCSGGGGSKSSGSSGGGGGGRSTGDGGSGSGRAAALGAAAAGAAVAAAAAPAGAEAVAGATAAAAAEEVAVAGAALAVRVAAVGAAAVAAAAAAPAGGEAVVRATAAAAAEEVAVAGAAAAAAGAAAAAAVGPAGAEAVVRATAAAAAEEMTVAGAAATVRAAAEGVAVVAAGAAAAAAAVAQAAALVLEMERLDAGWEQPVVARRQRNKREAGSSFTGVIEHILRKLLGACGSFGIFLLTLQTDTAG